MEKYGGAEMKTDTEYIRSFSGFDRFGFPQNIIRVTAGFGGEALLIKGSEKTALLDCGMAYCADGLIENIKEVLGERKLSYVLLSHTHYDHIGALPFIKQTWPEAMTFGAGHADKILRKEGAVKTINALSENARILYRAKDELKIPENGFTIDKIVGDGDRISLGKEEMVVLETKGHTDCSLTFFLEPQGVMFMSESTGCLEGPEKMHVSILKSYKDALNSVEKCRNYGAVTLISPHYGIIPEYYNNRYWELFVSEVENYKEFLFDMFSRNLAGEEILIKYEEKFWDDRRKSEQPKEAFLLNAKNIIKVFRAEFDSRH